MTSTGPVQHEGASMADLTHLGGAVARDAGETSGGEFDHWGGLPVPAYVRVWHRAAAITYVGHLERGETGEAITYLHGLRYSRPGEVDPWRLAEAIAERALARKDT